MTKFLLLNIILVFISGACSQATGAKKIYIRDMKKFNLVGEWYARATLVDKQTHSSFAFTGMECPVERIKFKITRDKLLALGSFDAGNPKLEHSSHKSLVAAFKILEHYDLAEEYNPEYEKDIGIYKNYKKNWQNREYIKVDWSNNLSPNLACNSWLTSMSFINLENNNAKNLQDIFRVRVDKDYIESTVNSLVTPDTQVCDKIGEINCPPSQYRVKFSFKKIAKTNYTPKNYPDFEYLRVGKNNSGYCLEGESGCGDTKELWLYSDSHRYEFCDPLRHDVSKCFSPSLKLNSQFGFFRTLVHEYDEQMGFARRKQKKLINRWNIWDENNLPKKIIYYLTPGFSEDLIPAAQLVAQDWNTALQYVVAQKLNQCNPDSIKEISNKLDSKIDFSQELTTNCKIIYQETKNKNIKEVYFTGEIAEIAEKFGDLFELRENACNKNNIKNFEQKYDLTNYLSQAGLNFIDNNNIEQACAVLEQVSLDLNLPEIFRWEQVGDLRYSFINLISKKEEAGLLGYGPSGVDPKTGEIINANANIYLATIKAYATKSALLLDLVNKFEQEKDNSNKVETLPARSVFAQVSRSLVERSNNIKSPHNKAQEVTENFKKILQAKENFVDDIDNLQILKNLAHKQLDLNKLTQKEEFYSARSACFSKAQTMLPYGRIRNVLQNKDLQEKIAYLVKYIFINTLRHEIGHTLGLRHNFRGAYDALNYPPDFWQVHTDDFRMRPGLSEEELRSSSIMDYHGHFNSDFSGLGLYDYAALAAGYADLVEVFDTHGEDFVPHNLINKLSYFHYRDYPYLFAGADAEEKILEHRNRIVDKKKNKNYDAHMDIAKLNISKNPKNIYKRKLVDYNLIKKNILGMYLGGGKKNISQVPYMFCTDGEARKSDLTCQPYVLGSSPSEIINNTLKDYKLGKKLERVGGQITPQNPINYILYSYSRVYQPILRAMRKLVLLQDSSVSVYPLVYDYGQGVGLGLNYISRVLQSVEPGDYCLENNKYIQKEDNRTCSNKITVSDMVGEKYFSEPDKIGDFYDKLLALLVLIDNQSLLEHNLEKLQNKNYGRGFSYVMGKEVSNIFGNIISDNWEKFGPKIEVKSSDNLQINYSNLFGEEQNNKGVKIQPSSSESLREFALIFAMSGLSSKFDHHLDFSRKAYITRLSPRASISTANNNIARFCDPISKECYEARNNLDSSSLGYSLVKAAQDFVSSGDSNNPAGSWYKAHVELKRQKNHLQKARDGLGSTTTGHDIESAENLLISKQAKYEQFHKMLIKKVRLIDKISKLSELILN